MKIVKEIPDLLKDKQKHVFVIGLYAKAKKVTFENVEQQQSFLKRYLRPARDLIGYNTQKIIDTMKYLIDSADYKWTLETVGKFIDEDLKVLKTKGQTEDQLIDDFINNNK